MQTYTIKIYFRGKHITKASGLTNRRKAEAMAKKLEADLLNGHQPLDYANVAYTELMKDLITNYKNNGKKSLDRLGRSLLHLDRVFGGWKVSDITTNAVRNYTKERLSQTKPNGKSYANATINRELAALKAALNLGRKGGKLAVVPYIEMLKENNVRRGYVNQNQFDTLAEHLPRYIRYYVRFCYLTGMRREEVAGLTWANLNKEKLEIRLEGTSTKSGEPRIIPLVGEIKNLIQFMHMMRTDALKHGQPFTDHIFPNRSGIGPIKDFRYVWNKACRESGLGYGYRMSTSYVNKWKDQFPSGPLLHDMRRSFATNATEAGIPEKVVQEIGGWKTTSTFKRYQIVQKEHIKAALEKQENYLRAKSKK